MAEKQAQDKDFKYFVRIANTDLDGNKPVAYALTKIKGVSYMLANAMCNIAGVDREQKIGTIKDADAKKLDDVLADPLKHKIPTWMLNRRKDYADGEDRHVITGDLKFAKENDVKRLMKIKSYRGLRLSIGLTVRGQRTKSNFRRNKGKGSLGVKKKSK